MAAMPCEGERRAKAFITKAEKAKKTPAINPLPSAEVKVKIEISLSTFPILSWIRKNTTGAYLRAGQITSMNRDGNARLYLLGEASDIPIR